MQVRFILLLFLCVCPLLNAADTKRPLIHGQHWMAVTGKPLAASAGAQIFAQGGNAVDAACAMLAAAATMWDTLGWGGETQALIWHPELKKVIGINALGVAPTGATPEYFRNLGMLYPPEYGPLAAVTPGTAGGLFTMLAEYGELSLADVLAPAIHMADGYPIEEDAVRAIITHREEIEQWPSSAEVFLPNNGEPPSVGQIFRQPKLAATLRKLVEAETRALAMGASREAAIYAAYDRFYRGDIAQEFVRGSQALGGLHTMEDLDRWQVHIETPVSTNFRGIDVYKLTTWVQGPMMLQALNMLEPMDLAELGYNSPDYIHVLYQVLNHAFADRDFYYGDPYFPPEEPIAGLLSKEYAAARAADISPRNNDPLVQPGDPYPYQGDTNPFLHLLHYWRFTQVSQPEADPETEWVDLANFTDAAARGTTSIQAADANGWLVSITPSGGWIPATIAGDTGIGMSQRMQSFVLDQRQNPFNVLEPGKRPRATLTPTIAVKDGKPWLAFSMQGGDFQDQSLLQFFLNRVEFGMDIQQAAEAANFWSFQFRNSFDDHRSQPGVIQLSNSTPEWVIRNLQGRGYRVLLEEESVGPITAIEISQEHGTLMGATATHGDDHGIGW